MVKDENLNKTRGERVKRIRKELGLTQEQLADKLGITAVYVSQIEHGKSFSLKIAKKIAKMAPFKDYALDSTRHEWVMGEDDFRTPEELRNAMWERATIISDSGDAIIHAFASSNGYSFKLIENEPLPDSIIVGTPCYAIMKEGLVVAFLSLEDYCNLRQEIANYSRYLLDKTIERQKRKLPRPIILPENE